MVTDLVEALAREMYERIDISKPTWDQLGGVTKSVWLERAQKIEDQDLFAPDPDVTPP